MKIGFGMIDARDDEVISIDGIRAMNKHNAVVVGRAEAEYLNGLLDLQTAIREKYEPQLIDNKPKEGVDKWKTLDEAYELKAEEKKKTIKRGTDNLWYS
jgi:hypothetical protein